MCLVPDNIELGSESTGSNQKFKNIVGAQLRSSVGVYDKPKELELLDKTEILLSLDELSIDKKICPEFKIKNYPINYFTHITHQIPMNTCDTLLKTFSTNDLTKLPSEKKFLFNNINFAANQKGVVAEGWWKCSGQIDPEYMVVENEFLNCYTKGLLANVEARIEEFKKISIFFDVDYKRTLYRLVNSTWETSNIVFVYGLISLNKKPETTQQEASDHYVNDEKAGNSYHYFGTLPPPLQSNYESHLTIECSQNLVVTGGVTHGMTLNTTITTMEEEEEKWISSNKLKRVLKYGSGQDGQSEKELRCCTKRSQQSLKMSLNCQVKHQSFCSAFTSLPLKVNTSKLLVSYLYLPCPLHIVKPKRKRLPKTLNDCLKQRFSAYD